MDPFYDVGIAHVAEFCFAEGGDLDTVGRVDSELRFSERSELCRPAGNGRRVDLPIPVRGEILFTNISRPDLQRTFTIHGGVHFSDMRFCDDHLRVAIDVQIEPMHDQWATAQKSLLPAEG